MKYHRSNEFFQKAPISAKTWWSVSAALGLLCIGLDAWARAGGGHSYSGGGGFSGGGGGGGDGGGIAILIYLLISRPEIGVPVLLVVATVTTIKHLFNPNRTTQRAVKRLEAIPAAPQTSLDEIKSRDPDFDPDVFLTRVQTTENLVQKAWSKGDTAPVRHLLSDGLTRRFTTQLLIMKRQNIRNVTADHRIIRTKIQGVSSDNSFDTVHVAVEAEARDADTDATLSFEEAVAVAKEKKLESYVEIWSFLRKKGASTSSGNALLEGRCPNCGATLPPAQSTRCEHCKALVNSGQYDWVLAEITQAQEWGISSIAQVHGLEQLKAAAPGFNRQSAEDRASYLFWRWIEAITEGKVTPLAKVASQSLKEQTAAAAANGPAKIFKPAVGAVDLVACQTDVNGMDYFYAKVLWSSARSPKDKPIHQINVLSVRRKSGVADESGFSHAHCPECHGPLTENDTPTCDYCGATLDAGEKDWVLDAVIRPEEISLLTSAKSPDKTGEESDLSLEVPDMGSPRERTLLLMRMTAVTMADGVVTPKEMKLLKNASKRWRVPFDAVTPILEGTVSPEEVSCMKPSNPEGFFKGLVAAALVDGRIDSKERRLLVNIAKNLNMDQARAQSMMKDMAAQKAA